MGAGPMRRPPQGVQVLGHPRTRSGAMRRPPQGEQVLGHARTRSGAPVVNPSSTNGGYPASSAGPCDPGSPAPWPKSAARIPTVAWTLGKQELTTQRLTFGQRAARITERRLRARTSPLSCRRSTAASPAHVGGRRRGRDAGVRKRPRPTSAGGGGAVAMRARKRARPQRRAAAARSQCTPGGRRHELCRRAPRAHIWHSPT
jgi:hypothetical protein